jgi:probable rRNA maturation factor
MEITIQTMPGLRLPPWHRAEAAARKLLAVAGRPQAEVSVLLVDDARIQELNRDWRKQDKPTDVLSWPQEAAGERTLVGPQQPDILGDVVISVDTAVRQAQRRGWSLADETALLLIHGILHLLGYEDETEAGAEAMRKVERGLLGKPLDKVEPASGTAAG